MCQPARSGGQNVKCQSKWRPPWNLVILDFYVIENLVQSLYLNYLNNCLIPDTYFSHIEVFRFAKYCPIKTKEEAYYGCWIRHLWQCSEYLCRVFYEGAAYMAVLKNFLCLFYYLRIIRRADYRAENYGTQSVEFPPPPVIILLCIINWESILKYIVELVQCL